MAIDHIPYPEATNLARASSKSFYPLRIPVAHWQLRHFISLPEPDQLYYASGHDVYCLDTATKKRKLIAHLPFEARCTASGFGYVCVGGEEDGPFACIKLAGGEGARGVGERMQGVEEAVGRWQGTGANAAERRAASVKVEKIGEEIVNSISIHRIQDEEAHLDDIVAVLTNNDKTVRVYSLPQNLETTVLDLPFAMNHATISPDGQTLVAVGDYNQAYFFQREIQETPPQIPKPHNRLTSAAIEWTLTSVVTLHTSGPEATTGYFTTAWSPNARLVAVGSEGGYITVFDVEMLKDPDFGDEDAIVAVIPGSRADVPAPYPGAIRSMLFSPEPWDLLLWAEDQGRICIGDLRTGLKSKQVVQLEPKEEGLNKIVCEDVPADDGLAAASAGVQGQARDIDELEADFIRRYRQAPDNATAVNFATEYIEARRRQRQQRQDMATLRAQAGASGARAALEDDPRGLTAREQQILESLRTTRQREEARAQGHIPRSVNYTTPDMFSNSGNRSSTSTPSTADPASARPISEILSSVQDSFPELSRTNAASPRPSSSHANDSPSRELPPLHTLQDGMWAQPSLRSSTGVIRLNDGSRLPRRRESVILTPPTNTSTSTSTSNSNSSTTTSQSRLHQPPTTTNPTTTSDPTDDENPWRTIEEHMTLARGPLFESAARAQAASPLPAASATAAREAEVTADFLADRGPLARSLAQQRERWRSLRAEGAALTIPAARFPEGYETLLRRTQLRGFGGGVGGRDAGVRTAGLAMSPDGRTLWAACEEGVFEIEMEVKGRGFWGSVEPL